jgi:hypothetical protein
VVNWRIALDVGDKGGKRETAIGGGRAMAILVNNFVT